MKRVRLNMNSSNGYPCIEDDKYEEDMANKVKPYLDKLRKAGYYERENGKPLYYESFTKENSRGTVVVLHGFTESLQKFMEPTYYFLRERYSVFTYDHRGHGKSFREVDNYSLTHIDSYEDYVEDLKGIIDNVVLPLAGSRPIYLYAHSMGGGIAARYLQLYPGTVKKAILTAPMLDINTHMPKNAAKSITKIMLKFGKEFKYAPTHSDFDGKEDFENSYCNCRERYHYYYKKQLENKELQNSGASYKWVDSAIRLTEDIQKCEKKINIPLCIFSADNDNLVKREGQLNIAEKTPGTYFVEVPDTKHEIYMAKHEVQSQYWRFIFSFLGSRSEKFEPIDMENWERKEHFEYYTKNLITSHSMTVDVDITEFLRWTKENKYKFFPSFLYVIMTAVNENREFRMAYKNSVLGFYKVCHPSYTIFHKDDKTFSDIWTEYKSDFPLFYKNCVEDMNIYKDVKGVKTKPGRPENFCPVSCTPWVTYTSLSHDTPGLSNMFFPVINFGKYYEDDKKVFIPVSVYVNHAAADGYHTSKLIQDIQRIGEEIALDFVRD